MIKINLLSSTESKAVFDYFTRYSIRFDGLDIISRKFASCGGDMFLFDIMSDNHMCGNHAEWVAINEDDVKYVMKYSFDDLPDERDQYGKYAVETPGVEFIGVMMNNGNTFMCPSTEISKLERLIGE